MKQNKTKLGIVTLMITAIVCFIVAILGMGMVKNSVPTMADTSSIQEYTATLSGPDDGARKTVFIQTRLPRSEDATKVYIEYVLTNDNLVGNTANLLALAYPQGAGTWDYKGIGLGDNTNVLAANNGGLYTASYKITYDLQTNGITWYRGTTELINSAYDVVLADMEKFGLMLQPSPVGDVITFKVYDDMGKNLGITTNTPESVTIEYPQVTFEANNGEQATVVEVSGTTVSAPAAPVKEGYIFSGWCVDVELTTAYDFTKEVSQDMTLYAKWVAEPTKYYMISDASQSDPWQWTTAEAPAENATKVTIVFRVISRTGTGRHFQTLATDGAESITSTLSPFYKFGDDWFPNGGTSTFVADLTTKTYALYDPSGNEHLTTTFSTSNKFGAITYKEYPAAVIGLYEVLAFDDTGKDLGITSSSAGVTITTDKVYTVTMNTNNGTSATSTFVEEGSLLTETTPLYAGHLFKGWFTDAECTTAYDFSQEVSSDLTLYAKWVSIENIVEREVALNGEEGVTSEFHVMNRLPHSEGATKVYIEYTLGNDDAAGHSFLFGTCTGTAVVAFSQKDVWNAQRYNQANSHVVAANNPGLYTGNYTVIFDFVNGTMKWYRETNEILAGTGENFADSIAFGFHTYTTAVGGSTTFKIYDDMGKDLGVTTWFADDTIVEYPKATFDANYEGGEDKVVDVTDATISAPTDVVRPAYKLVGWYTDAECTTAYDFTKEVAGDITVYAKWEEIPQVVVTFNANGGTDVDPQTINIDTTATAPTSTKTGFDLEGWYLDEQLTEKFNFDTLVTENITLYANWVVKVLTITFNTNGGNTVDDGKVEYNQALAVPTAPTKAGGYDFVGWFVDETLEVEYDFELAVTESFTLYAKWIEATYVVDFNVDGGSEVASQEFNFGETLAAPTAPAKAGYAFMGWYFDADFARKANFPIVVENDITLYAKWEVVVFTVSFDTDGGTEIEAQQVNSGSTIVAPDKPEKEGFIFDGWYVEVNGTEAFDFNTAIDADITLYARWKAVPVDNDTNLIDKVMSKLGCAGSLAQDSFMIIGTMLTVAGVIVIKALKKKED